MTGLYHFALRNGQIATISARTFEQFAERVVLWTSREGRALCANDYPSGQGFKRDITPMEAKS